jgi:hypothetical protein
MKRRIWHFGIMAALFLLSLLPRIKNIQTGDYPTVIPHLQVLQTIRVWDEVGPGTHAFLPTQTWSNPNDKFMTYFERLQNDRGDNYYVSYPPFAFILAWGFCKVFGLPFSVLSITILNLLLQWLAMWFIFGIVKKLIPQRENQPLFWPGLAAAAIFICNPASMRIFSQVYFSESVGTFLFCAFAYFAVGATQNPKSFWGLGKMGISIFLLVYCEWIGIFATLCFGIFWAWKSLRNISFLWPLATLVLFGLGGILLFAYQLDLITGSGDFIANLQERYEARSGLRDYEKSVGDTVFKAGFWEWFLSTVKGTMYAARWYFPLLLLTAIVYLKRKNISVALPKLSYGLFAVLFIIVLVNFAALLNFSIIHSYTWAKWGIPLSLAVAWCVHVLMAEKKMTVGVIVFMAAFFITDLIFYYGFGRIDEASKYMQQQTVFIKENASPDESIFITTVSEDGDPTFHLTYYTHRNMSNVRTEEEAKDQAAKRGLQRYVWFDFNQSENRMEAHHIHP